MLSVVLAVLLAAGGSSGGGMPVRPHVVLSSSRDAAADDRTISSIVTTFNGTVTSLDWTQSVAGIDGVGAGNDVFRVAVLVEGVDVCHFDVACDATTGVDYVATCSEPAFASGNDVDVRITSMPCLVAPTGFQTLDLTLR